MKTKIVIVAAVLAALAMIAVMVGQSDDVIAQNQTIATSGSVTNVTKLVQDKYSFDREGKGYPLTDLTVA